MRHKKNVYTDAVTYLVSFDPEGFDILQDSDKEIKIFFFIKNHDPHICYV